ncbi:O-antigen ligase domain-containing protein [Salicibibacter halophilus]|uniref:O-antigen ligase domain-containing protein n=2 Tax=Salicibibacter halophilus TaxID=2502791 RepID=A0A514LF27_9BACI|nr:O-antigen ligase domain-containing protein [Salicibibacter halophilus]
MKVFSLNYQSVASFLFLFFLIFAIIRPSPTQILGEGTAVRVFDIISFGLGIILFAFIIFRTKKTYLKQMSLPLSLFMLILLVFLAVISTYFSTFDQSYEASLIDLAELFKLIYYIVIFYFAYIVSRYVSIGKFIKYLLIGGFISLAIATLQYFNPANVNNLISYIYTETGLRDISSSNPRVFGTLYNPNWFGVFLGMWTVLLLSYFGIQKKNLFSVIILLCGSTGIILSGSRTAIISFILSLLVIYILFVLYNRSVIQHLTFPLITVGAFYLIYDQLEFNNIRLQELNLAIQSNDISQVAAAQSRIDLWNIGLEHFINNPLIGIGFANSIELSPHNSFILLLAQFGVLGGLIFIVFFTSLFFNTIIGVMKSEDRLNKSYCIGFIGCIVVFLISIPDFARATSR